jgi:uncharacterized repeat protein (TIGR03803 family)
VYKVDPTGQETVLHSFTGGADGAYVYAGVIRDSAGNLYGTTWNGGAANAGVVFRVDAADQETVLYNFRGGGDGTNPYAGLTAGPNGALYGTTVYGGTAGSGTVFELIPPAIPGGAWTETVLYNFTAGIDGAEPWAGVIRDPAGNLYGTTSGGGAFGACASFTSSGCGVVFKLNTAGNYRVLYRFTGYPDGASPAAGVIRDSTGNLYGTTPQGGAAVCSGGCGVVFKLDTAGSETVLYTFTGSNGVSPAAGVIRDSAGNLYGTAGGGGASGYGVVFKVDTAGHETGAIQLHGRGPQPQRCDPRLGRQSLRDRSAWRERVWRRSIQAHTALAGARRRSRRSTAANLRKAIPRRNQAQSRETESQACGFTSPPTAHMMICSFFVIGTLLPVPVL